MSEATEPAFPITARDDFGNLHVSEGLTKRELFAMAAMQGVLANSYEGERNAPLSETSFLDIAHMAVDQADELLKALEESA